MLENKIEKLIEEAESKIKELDKRLEKFKDIKKYPNKKLKRKSDLIIEKKKD